MGLLDALPGRHADFGLTLAILDLQNVPLVSGSFSVEWKFKSSKAHPEAVINNKANGLASRSHHNLTHLTSQSTTSPTKPSSSSSDGARSRTVSAHTSSTTRPLKKTPTSTSFSTLTTTTTNSSTTSSTSSSSESPPSSLGIGRAKSVSSKTTRRRARAASYKDEHGHSISTSSRGQTDGVQIRDHACSWSQEVRSHVRLGVSTGKDAGQLGERILSLIVHQHLSVGDATDKSARLGQLDLNLAEYVGKGGRVTRRYLLDEGKTNATIKLSVEMRQIGGQEVWNPIAISKGQAAGAGLEDLVGGGHNRPIGSVTASPNMTPSMSSTSLASQHHPRSTALSRAPSSLTLPSHVPLPASRAPSSSHLPSLLHPHHHPHSHPPHRSTSTVSFSSTLPNSSSDNVPTPLQTRKAAKASSPHRPGFKSTPSATGAGFLAPTSTEAIIENLFNPYQSSTPGPFTVPIVAPPEMSRSTTATSLGTQDGEDFVMIGAGGGGHGKVMESSPLNPNPVGKTGGKLAVPSSWKKRGRVESGGNAQTRGREEAGAGGCADAPIGSRATSRERLKV